MIDPKIMSLAQRLATSPHRYITDGQLVGFRARWGMSADDARRAAILADRIRRHQQAAEGRPNFHVVPVGLHEPIELQPRRKKRWRPG